MRLLSVGACRFHTRGAPGSFEPHAHGRSNESVDLLRAYQVAGLSKSSPMLSWRIFEVSKMSALSASEDTFEGTRSAYNPDDPAMEHIYCRL